MEYCIYCMNKKNEVNGACIHCGRRERDYSPAPHILAPGTMLYSRYLVGVRIGNGGFGITYIGRDMVLDIRVAIKEFYPSGVVNRAAAVSNTVVSNTDDHAKDVFRKGRKDFLSEARTLAKFADEPGIVGVRDFFEENHTVYIVMDYVDGQTLKEYLKERGTIPCSEMVGMFLPIMSSLEKVHEKGLLHRDISPDNIILYGRNVTLIDFGATRDYEDEKSHTTVLKHGYAPIEQYRRHSRQGPWTDVYALCATMYKCVTGKKPYDSLDRNIKDDLRPPSQFGVKIDAQFEQILMRGLAVNGRDRFQSVSELINALLNGYTPPVYADDDIPTMTETETPMNDSDVSDIYDVPYASDIPDAPKDEPPKRWKPIIAAVAVLAVVCLVCIIALSKRNNSDNTISTSEITETTAVSRTEKEEMTTTTTVSSSRSNVEIMVDSLILSEVAEEQKETAAIFPSGTIIDDEIELYEIETKRLSVQFGNIIYPGNSEGYPDLTWTSSDDTVALVDNGLVTAIGEGTAIITAETSDGDKDTCKVTVKRYPVIRLDSTDLNIFIECLGRIREHRKR